jgi:hypothetical protein
VHLSSDGSSWLWRSNFVRWFLLVVVVVAVFVGWRWHKAHLPTPVVPSVWVNSDKADGGAAMFKWVITGQQISGIYVDDDPTNPGCFVEPFTGRIDGNSLSLTATFMDGSGTVIFAGTVSASKLDLDGKVYSAGSAKAFATALVSMKYPSCGPGSS